MRSLIIPHLLLLLPAAALGADNFPKVVEPFLAKNVPYRWVTLLACLCVAASVHADVVSDNDKTMLLNKPVFTLRLNTQDCRYVLRLNGVQINRNDSGDSSTVNIPVNHWMRTGANELSLSLLTFKGKYPISPEARCEVSLQVRPDEGTEAQTVTISRLVFSGKLASAGSKGIEESTAAGSYDSTRQFFAVRRGCCVLGFPVFG